MKKYILPLLLSVCIIAGSALAYASDITSAKYLTTIQISNNGTALTDEIAVFTLSTEDMIANSLLNSSANESAMLTGLGGSDLAFGPSVNSTYPWVTWVNAIGANANSNEYLYTKDVTGGKIRYFPAAAGANTTDSASMEPSDNFTMEWKGYLNTDNGTDKNLVNKPGAVKVFVSDVVSGNITAIASNNASATRENYSGSNDGNAAVLGVNWSTQTFTSTTGFYIYSIQVYQYRTGAPGNVTASIRLVDTATGKPTGTDLVSGTVSANGWGAGPTWETVTFSSVYIIKPGITYALVFRAPSGSAGNQVGWSYDVTAPTYTGGSYGSTVDSGATWTMSAGIDANFRTVGTLYDAVSATGVASGEKTVTVTMDSPFLSLNPDGAAAPPVTANLIMNAPLWQTDSSASPFTTIDSNGFTATVTGAVWTLNQGYNFDGVDDYLTVTDGGGLLDFTSENFTVIVWIHPTTVVAEQSVFARGTVFGDGYLVHIGNNGRLYLLTNQGAALQNNYTAEGVVTAGVWQQVVVVRSGVNAVFYNNAVSFAADGPTPIINPLTSASNPLIGVNTALGEDYAGLIGEIQVYEGAFTSAQVLQNYNATKSKYTTGDIYTVSTLASVPDNANDWTDVSGGSMPYVEYIKKWVGGNLVQDIEWEYDTTFTDLSGNGNDMTPSFRTTSSDPDLSASIISQAGLVIGTPATTAVSGGWTMVTTVPSTPAGLFTDGGGNYKIFGFDFGQKVTDAATAAGQNTGAWHIIFSMALVITAMILVYKATHNTRAGRRGSLILSALAGLGVMVYFYNVGTLPGLALIILGLFALLLIVWRKSPSPVD